MDDFKEMDTLVSPQGERITVEEFSRRWYNNAPIAVYKNSKYQVIKREIDGEAGLPNVVWLSIKRIDKECIHDWRDLQEIKNKLVGEECEGIELYPAESRCVDLANQYHLWVFNDPEYRLPFGFKERAIGDEAGAKAVGAKQRERK